MQQLLDQLLGNQIVTGLSTTAVLGSLAYYIKEWPKAISNFILDRIMLSVSINSLDESYNIIQEWLLDQDLIFRKNAFSLNTKEYYNGSELSFRSAQRVNWLRYKGSLIRIIIAIPSTDGKAIATGFKPIETIYLQSFTRNNNILSDIIKEAVDEVSKKMVSVSVYSRWWGDKNLKNPRHPDTLILNEGVFESIVNDIDWFLKSRQWYEHRGIPYRRGYLFSGKPGTGKTSLVFVLAGMLNKPIYSINLGALANDTSLFESVMGTSTGSIILLEDIDCANSQVRTDEEDDKDDDKGVTLSGLLNVLDGINTPDNRIFILTTNFPDKLDSALIRPGRVDMHTSIDFLNAEAQVRMAKNFYDTPFVPLSSPVSAARLQEAFMRFPTDPDKAREFLSF